MRSNRIGRTIKAACSEEQAAFLSLFEVDKIRGDGFGVRFGVHDGTQRQWKRKKAAGAPGDRSVMIGLGKSQSYRWFESSKQGVLSLINKKGLSTFRGQYFS